MSSKGQMGNWTQMFRNPYSLGLRNIFAQLLKQDYVQYEDIIERVSNTISTEKDYEQFGNLIMAVYEQAYQQCVQEHKHLLEQAGIKVNISRKEDPPQDAPSIF